MQKILVLCGAVKCLYNSSQYGGFKTYCIFKNELELYKSSNGDNILVCKWYRKREREHELH